MGYAGYLFRLRLKPGNSAEFLSSYLNSRKGKTILRGMAKSIVGMANINAKEVQTIRIPKPPGDIQNFFAGFILEIEAHKRLHRLHLEKLDELFASLQHRAFRGEL